jgi:hypothetical protein
MRSVYSTRTRCYYHALSALRAASSANLALLLLLLLLSCLPISLPTESLSA